MNTEESIEFLLRTSNHLQAIGEHDSIVNGLKELDDEAMAYSNELRYLDSKMTNTIYLKCP